MDQDRLKQGGSYILGHRRSAGLTPGELGEAIGVEDRGLIVDVEGGVLALPEAFWGDVAKALRVPSDEFTAELARLYGKSA